MIDHRLTGDTMNVLAKAVGLRWFDRDSYGWNARFSWAEVSGRFGCAVALCSFEEHYSLHIHSRVAQYFSSGCLFSIAGTASRMREWKVGGSRFMRGTPI